MGSSVAFGVDEIDTAQPFITNGVAVPRLLPLLHFGSICPEVGALNGCVFILLPPPKPKPFYPSFRKFSFLPL
jgi:hypothetical protein